MIRARGVRREPDPDVRESVVGPQRDDCTQRHVAHRDLRQVVGGVLADDADAAALDLLGHDRRPHAETRNQESRGATAEERQQPCELPRGLEGEHDRREQRARRAGEHRRHADERGDADVDAGGRGGEDHDAPERRAEPAADREERRQRTARRTAAERDRPRDQLPGAEHEARRAREVAGDDALDVVVADAHRAGRHQADHADHRPAERGPPHPMDREACEPILDRVHEARDGDRRGADERADRHVDGERQRRGRGHVRHREDGCRADEGDAHCGRDGRRERHGDEGAGPILEEKQLDREQHCGDRAAERRGHAGGGAGREQRLPLGRRRRHDLSEPRAERAAGRDDRPFGAERAPGADRDRRRQRLQQGHAARDAARVGEDLFHCLGNAVAADRGRPEPRHDPDEDAPGDRHEDHPDAEPMIGRRHEAGGEAAVEGEVGDEADHAGQELRHPAGRQRQHHGEPRDDHVAVLDQRRPRREGALRERRAEGGRDGQSVGRRRVLDVVAHHAHSSKNIAGSAARRPIAAIS